MGKVFKKGKKPKLGSGKRFKALESSIAKEGGVSDPGAVAASIGRKKFGAKKFASLGAKGKKRAAATRKKTT